MVKIRLAPDGREEAADVSVRRLRRQVAARRRVPRDPRTLQPAHGTENARRRHRESQGSGSPRARSRPIRCGGSSPSWAWSNAARSRRRRPAAAAPAESGRVTRVRVRRRIRSVRRRRRHAGGRRAQTHARGAPNRLERNDHRRYRARGRAAAAAPAGRVSRTQRRRRAAAATAVIATATAGRERRRSGRRASACRRTARRFWRSKLVSKPDEVIVEVVDGSRGPVIELEVHPDDFGKVIGKGGRVAQALRTLVRAAPKAR